MDHSHAATRLAEGYGSQRGSQRGSRRSHRRPPFVAVLLLVLVLAGCGGGASHKSARSQPDPVIASTGSVPTTPDSDVQAAPSNTPTPSPRTPVSTMASTARATAIVVPSATPTPVLTGPSAADLAMLRTNAIDRCQRLIANAPAAGPCQYIRTIVPASDTSYVYVEVAASGHDGSVYHRNAGSYLPVLDNGDQPPPCSTVTGAGIPLAVWTDIVHQIEGNSVGETCYS